MFGIDTLMNINLWTFPEGALANTTRSLDDEHNQANLVDRTVTKIAKSMSPPPPAVIVTPPAAEHSTPKLESPNVNESETASMTAEPKGQDWVFATPAGLRDLTRLQQGLKQYYLDGRAAPRDERREQHKRNFSAPFNPEAPGMDTVEPRPGSVADGAAGLCQARVSQSEREEALYSLKEFLEEDAKWSRNDELLSHSSSLERNEGSRPATGPEIAGKEYSSPPTFEETRKADGGVAVAKSRENDGWVKVKAPLKRSTTEEDWELLEADQDEEEWTLV